jgi:ribose/xylose/arabinose/galactoside ABC-type transport system permease subunit
MENYLIWVFLAAAVVACWWINAAFFSTRNLMNILLGSTTMGMMAIAATLPFLIGKFDLSIESTLAFSAMIGAMMALEGNNSALSMATVLLIGVAIGLINGLAIVCIRVNPFIQTLAMNIIFRGLIFYISGGRPFRGFPTEYRVLGSTSVFGIPTPIILTVASLIVFDILLARTVWGRSLYALGQNKEAAFANGIPIGRITITVFTLSGFLAAFSGLVLSCRMNSIDYNVGIGMVFDVFAAVVIGGIAMDGGRGKLSGAMGGVLFMVCVSSLLSWMDISVYWVDTVRGFIILFAVWLDAAKRLVRARVR